MRCVESVARCAAIFLKERSISGISRVKRKEYARIAIEHLCEGRVEPPRAICEGRDAWLLWQNQTLGGNQRRIRPTELQMEQSLTRHVLVVFVVLLLAVTVSHAQSTAAREIGRA